MKENKLKQSISRESERKKCPSSSKRKRLQFNGDNELYEIELRIKKEAEEQKFNKIKYETQ